MDGEHPSCSHWRILHSSNITFNYNEGDGRTGSLQIEKGYEGEYQVYAVRRMTHWKIKRKLSLLVLFSPLMKRRAPARRASEV
ncbi:hypothetical protein [Prevotella sp.]|uniref:hypothetical protein n=1 Tax=Prevotella sp. TaxID=59823 RepID=UPI0027E2F382|nr:hypothetical protein [Prevotella sp.]